VTREGRPPEGRAREGRGEGRGGGRDAGCGGGRVGTGLNFHHSFKNKSVFGFVFTKGVTMEPAVFVSARTRKTTRVRQGSDGAQGRDRRASGPGLPRTRRGGDCVQRALEHDGPGFVRPLPRFRRAGGRLAASPLTQTPPTSSAPPRSSRPHCSTPQTGHGLDYLSSSRALTRAFKCMDMPEHKRPETTTAKASFDSVNVMGGFLRSRPRRASLNRLPWPRP